MSTQAAVLRTMSAVAAELEAEGAEIIGSGIGGISPPQPPARIGLRPAGAHRGARGVLAGERPARRVRLHRPRRSGDVAGEKGAERCAILRF